MLSKWSKDRPERFASPAELSSQFKRSRSLGRWAPGAHELMARSILREDPAAGDWFLCCPPEGESRIYLTNSGLDLCPRLGELKGPVKFVTSDPDDPNARAPGLVNRALHAEYGHPYEIVPETTHMAQVERPDSCAAIVTAFLDETGFGA
jgi:pimeloyl-ACP methyl ester carboxylesterase